MQEVVTRICTLLPALRSHRSRLRQINIDLERESNDTELHFPLDFYEIHNFLFPLSPGARDPEVVKYYFDHFAHQMVLLPPSAWEFIRNLEHQSRYLRGIYHPAASDIDEFLKSEALRNFCDRLEKGAPNEQIMDAYRAMGQYRRLLDYLGQDAVQTVLQEPAQSFVKLLDDGRLAALEDVCGGVEWQDLDEQAFGLALDALDEQRPAPDKHVPNRIDAMNMAIVFALNARFYQSARDGKFFLLVTHGGATRRAYATVPWRNDPYYGTPDGTFVHRNHLYCAEHAYFDGRPEPRGELDALLEELTEVDSLQGRFEALVQRIGRDGLAKLPTGDAGAAAELRSIADRLGDLKGKLAPIEQVIHGGRAARQPWQATPELMNRLKSKDEILAVVRECVVAANRVTQEVYDRVKPIMGRLPLPMIDHQSQKTIDYIAAASAEGIAPERTEFFKLTALLKTPAGKSNRPLELDHPYELRVGVRWFAPDLEGEAEPGTPPEELTFQISVQGHHTTVEPAQVRPLTVARGRPTAWLAFFVTPAEIGPQQVRVQLYRRLCAVGRIDLDFRVVGNHQPPYLDPDADETALKERAAVSPPATADHVAVHITLRGALDDAYEGLIQCDGESLTTMIQLSPHDLESLNHRLQQAAKRLGDCSPADGSPPEAGDQQRALRELADQGKLAYNELFDAGAQQFLSNALRESPEAIIQITSDRLALPWDLLYDEDPVRADARRFWGMRYIISRLPLVGGDEVSPAIACETRPDVGLVTDLALDGVRLTEVPFFRELHENGHIHLAQLRPLDPRNGDAAIQEFIDFWHEEFQVAHLACHSSPSGQDRSVPAAKDSPWACQWDPYSARLRVSDFCHIPIDKLKINNFRVYGRPIVILNACHTGVVNSLYTTCLARMFLKGGARGVLATECSLRDASAARFTQALYEPLLKGQPLGESVLLARHTLMHRFWDPSGLLYALYGPAGLQLVGV